MDEDLLPEDDSIFNNLSTRTDNLSDDLMGDTSLCEPSHSSTPTVETRRSTRAKTAASAAVPVPSSPPARPSSPSGTRQSPRLQARAARSSSPAPASSPIRRPLVPQATKAPPKKAAAASGRLKCPKCPATLANKKTLDTHLRTHVLIGVTSKAPTLQDIHQEIGKLIKAAISAITDEKVIGDLSSQVHDYGERLFQKFDGASIEDEEISLQLSEHFYSFLANKKILFPSSIRSAFLTGTNNSLSNSDFMQELDSNLSSVEKCEDQSVMNVFIGNFMFILGQKVLLYCIQHMRGKAGQAESGNRFSKRSADTKDSLEFKQLVYHIAGSVVHVFLWKGKQYSKTSQVWKLYCEVLKSKLLVNEVGSNKCSDDIRGFSDKKDRGGYKHICDDAFSFFMMIFDLVMSVEGEDGSLPPNIIDNIILCDDIILCLWDSLVGADLNQEQSLDLLIQISQSCILVVKKGIMKRRLNQHLKNSLQFSGHACQVSSIATVAYSFF